MRWPSKERRRARRILFVALVILLLPGCMETFKNPLSDANDSKLDKRLLRHWVQGKHQILYMKAAEDGIHGEMHVISLAPEGTPTDTLMATFFCTVSGERKFLNIEWAPPKKEDPEETKRFAEMISGFSFCEYDITSDGELRLWTLKLKEIEKAVKGGELVAEGSRIVTSSSDLLAYVTSKRREDLFDAGFGDGVLLPLPKMVLWSEEKVRNAEIQAEVTAHQVRVLLRLVENSGLAFADDGKPQGVKTVAGKLKTFRDIAIGQAGSADEFADLVAGSVHCRSLRVQFKDGSSIPIAEWMRTLLAGMNAEPWRPESNALGLRHEVLCYLRLLDNEDWEVRERATGMLVQFGMEIEPLVREHLKAAETPECRDRCQTIIDRLAQPSISADAVLNLLEKCDGQIFKAGDATAKPRTGKAFARELRDRMVLDRYSAYVSAEAFLGTYLGDGKEGGGIYRVRFAQGAEQNLAVWVRSQLKLP